MRFPFYKQLSETDCGPTCLRMIARYYGRKYSSGDFNKIVGTTKEGMSLLDINDIAEKIGFNAQGIQLTFDQLIRADLPCILYWQQKHFVVLISVKRNRGDTILKIADPEKGIISYSYGEFIQYWWLSGVDSQTPTGIALMLEPTNIFFEYKVKTDKDLSWANIYKHLVSNKWHIAIVFSALFLTSSVQLIFPFLTQNIVDKGIKGKDLPYISIILIGQLVLIFSRTIIDFIKTRILLKISNTFSFSILSDFWDKIIKLPLSYFDTLRTGDTLQRIADHKEIQSFLTGSAFTTFFSGLTFIFFSIVLYIYSWQVFLIFCIGSIAYFLWIQLFLKIRKRLNYKTFDLASKENSATLQFVQGMQEIRLNNAELHKKESWQKIQAALLNLNFKTLTYSQWQQAGALFINQGKDFVITFFVAKLVIQNQMTLGAMVAIQYILGQLSGPIEQFVGFIQSAQNARISMERLNEIHRLENEESEDKIFKAELPASRTIRLQNINFSYPGAGNPQVLRNVNIEIPEGKVIAIVGLSGSGKTTLLKLLLRIFESYQGDIYIGNEDFRSISPSYWRKCCGAVLQDGYIFNDSIAGNIAMNNEKVDYEKLLKSCKMANILPFIESLPNKFNTIIGADGINISQGQRQRLLIARAIYKDPHFLFFDEATNALDANNEKEIVINLQRFFHGRTVIVVAHRLSTVKNADNIIVLEKGEIVESGTHQQLTKIQGAYFKLVKNQLELGS